MTRSNCSSETSGPISVSGSRPEPSLIDLAISATPSTTSSNRLCCDEQPRAGAAALAVVEEDRVGRARDRASTSASAKTMFGLLPPSSSVTFFRLPAGRLHDQLADLGRAGERDLVHVRVRGQRGAGGLAEAGDDVDHAVGDAGLGDQLGQPQRGQRRLLGGLEHHGAAGRQRRAELPRRHQQREVPRDDLARPRRPARAACRSGSSRRACRAPRCGSCCPRSWWPSRPCSGTGRRPAARRRPAATANGLPLSSDSSWASSSMCSRIRSPMRQMIRPRSDGVIRLHGPVSKARRAAATARSMSSASPSATRARISPVAGLGVSNVLPDAASTHSRR